jgi:hypothetical protein
MKSKTDIARDILDYLAKRPDGQDTFEGISDWFVRMDKGAYTVDVLKTTLDLLVEQGEVEKMTTRKDFSQYRVKRR